MVKVAYSYVLGLPTLGVTKLEFTAECAWLKVCFWQTLDVGKMFSLGIVLYLVGNVNIKV